MPEHNTVLIFEGSLQIKQMHHFYPRIKAISTVFILFFNKLNPSPPSDF